jgi:mannose-6-phosphate isomerase-like protein (cupin superfamily)
MKNLVIFAVVASCALAGCQQSQLDKTPVAKPVNDAAVLETQVLQLSKAQALSENWGVFKTYTTADTVGTMNNLFGEATIKPGQEIHPPHVHAEEEYLLVTQGEGTWTIGDKSFPAKTGDLLYAKPWESHGIRNTGDIPMKFIVWKWNSKGLDVPTQPN